MARGRSIMAPHYCRRINRVHAGIERRRSRCRHVRPACGRCTVHTHVHRRVHRPATRARACRRPLGGDLDAWVESDAARIARTTLRRRNATTTTTLQFHVWLNESAGSVGSLAPVHSPYPNYPTRCTINISSSHFLLVNVSGRDASSLGPLPPSARERI